MLGDQTVRVSLSPDSGQCKKNEVLISIAGAVTILVGGDDNDDGGEGELGVITGMETLGGVCRLT